MKKLVATAPRVAALVEYEDRAILANEVKIRVRFGAPKHGTEVVDFRAASPFIDEDFNGEWQMFTPRPADAPRGIEFGKFQLGNMVVGDIIECGSDVTDYAVGDSVCGYGPLSETVIINAVNNYKLRKMPQGSSWKNAVCYDPAQFAMSGVRDANVRVGVAAGFDNHIGTLLAGQRFDLFTYISADGVKAEIRAVATGNITAYAATARSPRRSSLTQ